MRRTHVYIVGAGFSKYAGLPLQAKFTEAMLEPRHDAAYPMRGLIDHLGAFVNGVFDHNKSAKADYWPKLEDVFTNIDLAANSGHHLGPNYSPSALRTARRVLLARMMCMLHERYREAESNRDADWMQLDAFLRGLDVPKSSFISMNWDTVIERRLAELRDVKVVDYGCGAIAARFPRTGNVVKKRSIPESLPAVRITKMHGSVNWLYCDNCRRLYWFPPSQALTVAKQLIRREEGEQMQLRNLDTCARWRCANCGDVPLTTRIATFSYLKALDFPMFEKSWLSAERALRTADKWIFIGYSLPAADFEFKHLLKRVQLSRPRAPEFVVITGGLPDDCDQTYANYQGFFGRGIKRESNFFGNGLSAEAVAAAHA
jgi:hypothetical protein